MLTLNSHSVLISRLKRTECAVRDKSHKVACKRRQRNATSLHRTETKKQLLHDFDVLNLNKSQLNSLDFVANRFLMKLFNRNNMQIIEFCCEQFNFVLPSRQIANRRDKFIKSDSQRTNLLTFVTMYRYYYYAAYMFCFITNLDKYMPFVLFLPLFFS